jgi:hypothetical protein
LKIKVAKWGTSKKNILKKVYQVFKNEQTVFLWQGVNIWEVDILMHTKNIFDDNGSKYGKQVWITRKLQKLQDLKNNS